MSNLDGFLKETKKSEKLGPFNVTDCAAEGLETAFYAYICGVTGIPLALKGIDRYFPTKLESKLAFGAVAAMGISYYFGSRAKTKCEENTKEMYKSQLRS